MLNIFGALNSSVEKKIDINRGTEPLLWKDDLQFQRIGQNIRSQKGILKFSRSNTDSEHVLFAAAGV